MSSSRRLAALVALAAAALVQIAAAPLARAAGQGDADAQALVDRAYAEHAAGKDVEAVGSYLKAYELTRVAAILYNVATIYDRRLHERALAMEYFRRYAQAPDAKPELVEKATARIASLKGELDEEEARKAAEHAASSAPAPAPPEVPPPAATALETPPGASSPADSAAEAGARPEPRESGWRPTGLIVGGVGLAAIGTSMALGLVAKGKIDEANTHCGPSTCSTAQGVTLEHQAVSFANAATITFVAGAALLAVGVTIFFVAPRGQVPRAQITLAPQVGLGTAGLALYSRF
jgi:hypothetical protein